MHKEHYKHVRSWNEPENDKKSGVELCPFTAAHYKLKIKEKDEKIEQLKKLVKIAYTEGHSEGSAFYGWEDSDSYEALKRGGDG
ncbi:hypothetical protein LCGC14_1977500 [marine sediment metagenome]|uniref:Uncharacterized protein n=1 Tax=marine sediment metagenome TaxID=412755 RepID=A0A0F9I6W4_9ZZZZ